jgi:hypothetical protein
VVVIKVLGILSVGKPEGKKLLRRPKHKWQDNMRKDVKEIDWEDVDWVHLAQDRDQWRTVVKFVP